MKTVPQVINLINTEIADRNKKILKVVEKLQMMKLAGKEKSEVSEEMKVSLIRFATEINEHKAVIATLENLKAKVEN